MAEESPFQDEEGALLDDLEESLVVGIISAYLSSIKIIKPSSFNASSFTDIDKLQEELRKQLTTVLPSLNNVSTKSIGVAIERTKANIRLSDFSFDYSDPRLAAHVQNVFDANIQAVIDTNEKTINAIINHGRDNGLSDSQIAKRIIKFWGLTPSHLQTVLNYERALLENGTKRSKVNELVSKRIDDLIDWRFTLVAKNISNDIVEGSKSIAFEQMKEVGAIEDDIVKQWVSVIDDRTTDTCLGLNKKQAEIGEPFQGGFMYPPAHIGCRSSVILTKRR